MMYVNYYGCMSFPKSKLQQSDEHTAAQCRQYKSKPLPTTIVTNYQTAGSKTSDKTTEMAKNTLKL